MNTFTVIRPKSLLFFLLLFTTSCTCNNIFFYPHKKLYLTPAQLGIDYETVLLQSHDGKTLHNWLLKPKKTSKGRIFFLHGNAQNISTHIRSVYWLPEAGYEVFLMEYRGFGQSTGSPCLPEIIKDIETAYQWFQTSNKKNLPLFVLGQSLGASLAAYSVGANPQWSISGVIVDSPFSGFRDIAKDKMNNSWLLWPFQYPVSQLFSDTYSPIHTIKQISPRPLLMFYSQNDKVVPASSSIKLYSLAKEPKHIINTNTHHIGTFLDKNHQNQLLSFLQSPATFKNQ